MTRSKRGILRDRAAAHVRKVSGDSKGACMSEKLFTEYVWSDRTTATSN